MNKFVKLKTDTYKELTKNRYYEVFEEHFDPVDGAWYYLVRYNNMIECGLCPQEDFEEPITHVRCINNQGCWGTLTVDKEYEIISINYIGGELITVKNDMKQTGQYSSKRFDFITKEKEEPCTYSLGAIAEPLEPLPQNIYHITYSLQYAEGAELADISKTDIIQIDGEIVSKGRAWVIETDKGTVIIPFKAIIHMHPQY